MSRKSDFAQDIISRQERMLRLAERDYDLTPPVLAAETGIPKETLLSWKRGVAMPAWALVLLCRVIPDELTTLMFEPVAKHVGTDDIGDGDLDRLARESAGYNVEYLDARQPDSDAGSDLSPRERANLKDRARRVASIARKAAA
jgi:hypothetical protein